MQQRPPHNHDNYAGITLEDVRRVLAAGRLLALALTPAERQALTTLNDGVPAECGKTGTGSAGTHRPQHIPAPGTS